MPAAALIISIVAVVLSGLAAVYTRRQSDAAARTDKREAAAANDCTWTIEPMRVNGFVLTNGGPGAALDVTVVEVDNADKSVHAVDGAEWPRIDPFGSETFLEHVGLGYRPRFEVHWTTPDDRTRSWSTAIP